MIDLYYLAKSGQFKQILNSHIVRVILPNYLIEKIEAGELITSDNAKDYIGKIVTIRGDVSQVTTTKSNTTFINIDGKYPDNKFTIVIFKDDAGKFPEVNTWEGKTIEVNGKVELYRDKPQIILKEIKQIKEIEKED